MNYKKIIALTAAISMLIFGGCSSSDEAAETTDAAESYSVSETTTAGSSETEAETVTEAETKAETKAETETETETETEAVTESMTEAPPAAADSISAEEAYSEKNGASWTDALMKSASTWDKGNVVFKCSASEEGEIVTTIEMSVYNNKVYMDTQVPGIMSMTMIIDGEKGYLIDKASKSYSFDSETTYDADSEVESVIDTTADYSSFTEDGIENIEGTDYIFEKFNADGSELVFYYSPDGKLKKLGTDGEIMEFTIDLLDEPDESCFEIPEDYTEISMEDMAVKMMAGLFSAMEEASEE
ncbi:MAG: hypothetical protein ACI4J0_02540 [Huintestinicola sp.]|uniref:hypothetical protein n=1 Tax=Huintestinicola sp. TaxID=2981661 RepID=UPI003F0CEBF6